MWFTTVNVKSDGQAILLRRVGHIIEVIEACKNSNCHWLEELVESVSILHDLLLSDFI